MKNLGLVMLLCFGIVFGAAAFCLAQDDESVDAAIFDLMPQTTCPVTGDAIDKKFYVDSYGKRIYVCCEECLEKVKADPERYIDQLEEEGVELEEAPINEEALQ